MIRAEGSVTIAPVDEVLRRIDEHMARGNEHMARGNDLMARGNELMDDVREEMRLNREEIRRNREAFELHKMAMAEMLDTNRRATDTMIERLNDLGEEVRAQTRAIFRLIDRLDGGAATA